VLFSQTTEYALRAVVTLASQHNGPMTTQEIAQRARIPANYLSKLLDTLRKAGLVEAQRGVGGGFRLARPASELTVLEVVNLVGPVGRVTGCPLGLAAHEGDLCALHRKLDQALSTIEQIFASTTIGELLEDGHGTEAPSACGSDGH